MSISELSETTIEELCFALEKCPALNWKVLMGWFHPLYSEDHIAIIERSESPAKALLVYLDHKEIPLKDLVNGLKAIGNKKAVSIIKKGSHILCNTDIYKTNKLINQSALLSVEYFVSIGPGNGSIYKFV